MSLSMNHLFQSVMSIGKPKEPSQVLKIKDNADHAGLSQLLVVLKDSIG
jgi:hypothetical protein